MEKSEANTEEAIIPRTENRTISRYFLAVASLNLFKKKKKITTLRWHVQTRLFLPRTTVRRSGASRERKKARPRGWLGCVLSAFRPRLMELLFIFVIFRGRPATAEEDCIC